MFFVCLLLRACLTATCNPDLSNVLEIDISGDTFQSCTAITTGGAVRINNENSIATGRSCIVVYTGRSSPRLNETYRGV
jgi:hypothetical protein